MTAPQRIYRYVAVTTGVALLISILPLPGKIEPWQIAWPQLVLIYWCMALPQYCGIKYAWITGLLVDLLHGGILGQHALLLVVLAYITVLLHQFIRFLPMMQQTLFIGLLLLAYVTLAIWIETMLHGGEIHWLRWATIPTSMVVWPWVFAVLRGARQRVRLN